MKPIKDAIIEVRKLQASTRFFRILLNTVIVFLVSFLVFTFFKLSWFWSFIPTTIYFLYILKKDFSRLNLAEVEKYVPELKEKLRTAADNVGRDDEIVEALNKEVMRDIRKIKVAQFVDSKQNAKKLIALGAMAFLILLIAAFNIDFFEVDFLNFNKFDENDYPTLENINKFEDYGFDEDIYGEESIVELGTEEVSIAMNTMSGGLNLNEQKEIDSLNFGTAFQSVTSVKADKSFNEAKLSDRKAKVVGDYFDQITKEG
jgi:hypothetical protein